MKFPNFPVQTTKLPTRMPAAKERTVGGWSPSKCPIVLLKPQYQVEIYLFYKSKLNCYIKSLMSSYSARAEDDELLDDDLSDENLPNVHAATGSAILRGFMPFQSKLSLV